MYRQVRGIGLSCQRASARMILGEKVKHKPTGLFFQDPFFEHLLTLRWRVEICVGRVCLRTLCGHRMISFVWSLCRRLVFNINFAFFQRCQHSEPFAARGLLNRLPIKGVEFGSPHKEAQILLRGEFPFSANL